ncbi:MAG: hypothetical protein ABIF06_00005, partial [bacterium]
MMFRKRILILFVAISLVFSAVYMPTPQTPRAQAILGVGDINLESIPTVVGFILQHVGMTMAKIMIDDMVRSTIDWANSGFEGGPAYNINPKQYFINLADAAAGQVIQNELEFLCSPFKDQIRASLTLNYYQPSQQYFQCTFSEALGNLDDFYQDFNTGGGWDTWFEMTQRPTNNPYGAYIEAQARIDLKINSEKSISESELAQSGGYFNYQKCEVYNPDKSVLDKIRSDLNSGKQRAPTRYQAPYDLSKQPGACIEQGDITTPGTAINKAVEDSLG